MQRFITTLTLAAFVAGSGVTDWRWVAAQEVSPETSQRLREAVDRMRAGGTGATIEDAAEIPLSEAELEELVAPFALYPDALLAQVLVAATYPDQISRARDLIARTDTMSDAELATALESDEWDPSVLVLLSGFPTVITRMADDLEGTRRLGTAMIDRDQDVLAAVQRMRVKAEAAGNLSSNAAQTVARDADQISISPAKSDVIYVPDYDADAVYLSDPSAVPYTYPQTQPAQTSAFGGIPPALVAGAVAFGGGLLVSKLFEDDEEEDSGWDDYWRRDRVIDWQDRQFYPRSNREARRDAWARERDLYWDRSNRNWRADEGARRYRDQDRRSALRWAGLGTPQRQNQRDNDLSFWREKARWERAREDRAAALRREQRVERREERREDLEKRARELRREDAQRDRRREAEQAERRREAEQAERRRENQAERRQDEQAERRQAERREAQQAERREAERREAQQAERREAERREAQQAERRKAERREAEQAERRKAEQAQRERRREREAAQARENRRDRQQSQSEAPRKENKQAKPNAERRSEPTKASTRDNRGQGSEQKARNQNSNGQNKNRDQRPRGEAKCAPGDNRKACK